MSTWNFATYALRQRARERRLHLETAFAMTGGQKTIYTLEMRVRENMMQARSYHTHRGKGTTTGHAIAHDGTALSHDTNSDMSISSP